MEAAGCCSPLGHEYRTGELAEMVQGLVQNQVNGRVDDLMKGILDSVTKDGQCLFTPEGKNLSDDDVTLIGLEVEELDWDATEFWHPSSLRHLQDLMDRYYELRREEWLKKGFGDPRRLKLCLEEAVANALLAWQPRRPRRTHCRAPSLRKRFSLANHRQRDGLRLG